MTNSTNRVSLMAK